ncbi:MAG: type II toxin-antitoxin system VapC family toxin [Deltaproteobacteria bacterium]|nr:type II toxin-antitoxin system VapC family toxin [Deltaproteobacteria bacterium]MBW2034264.1 type II toxin-antitoxin system VapC family toxin [Deltaproteobacteria bacterium]MBW2115513.1 type II toxin-antitoxin system VapC family toxin [Deltaproteobacteria bacterium]
MIVYLDTSSLVKLYVEEDESSKVDVLVKSSEVTATSLVAYAEARAAFARRFREKVFTSDEYNRLKEFFDKDWSRYLILSVTGDMIRLAGDLAEKYALRGFDSIHLASALTLRQELSSPIVFSCFDDNLQKASEREDLDQG